MSTILITEDGKKVQIGVYDICLYSAPENPQNSGTEYTRGVDLFAHGARSGNVYYYLDSWSMWQGEEKNTHLILKKDAIEFLVHKASLSGPAELSDRERAAAIEHFGEDIFQEDA